jgi:hypothetical protein
MPILMFLWLAAVTGAFFALPYVRLHVPEDRQLLVVAAVGIVVHLVPILLYPNPQGLFGIDIGAYETTASSVLHGRDVYAGRTSLTLFHPYLPFHMYVLAAAKLVADTTPVSFFTAVRIPNAAADIGTAVLILLTMRGRVSSDEAFRGGILYALCPLPMLIGVYHGQFDGVSVFFAVLSVFLLLHGKHVGTRSLSAVSLGLGILQKLWPVVLLILIFDHLRTIRAASLYTGIVAVTVMAGVILYVLAFDSTIETVADGILTYRTPYPRGGGFPLVLDRMPEFPGRGPLLGWWIHHGEIPTVVGVLAMSIWMIVRRVDIVVGWVATLCVLFTLIPNGDGYHYLWILPFALIAGHRLGASMITAAMTAIYVINGFLRGALYLPAVEGPGVGWLFDHTWWLSAILWLTFAVWGTTIAARALTSARGQSGSGSFGSPVGSDPTPPLA